MERSEAIWRTLLRANPDDLEARRVVANLFSNDQERLEQAEIVDQKLAEIDDPNELLNEGTNYLAAGDNERAFELLSRAATMHSGSEAVWFNLGLAADRLERWPTAIDAYREAYKLNQTRPETQLQLAAALVEIGDCAEAIPFFESGLVLDPEKTAAYYYLAGCYKVMGRAEDAAQAMAEYHRRSE
jgi:tetratricopeptide (TPR) repeat protein